MPFLATCITRDAAETINDRIPITNAIDTTTFQKKAWLTVPNNLSVHISTICTSCQNIF